MNGLKPPIEKGFSFYPQKHSTSPFLSLHLCWFYGIPLGNADKVPSEHAKSKDPLQKPSFECACSVLTNVLACEILLHKGANPG